LNPTLKTINEVGGQAEKGKKTLSKAEVYPMYKACKDSKDQGGFHDFVEILKLYDKNDDNTMIGNELFRLLTNLGEKLTKEEAKGLMKELCEPEDDDGFMPFIRKFLFFLIYSIQLFLSAFLERMCAAEK
jgi:Ca2+-binding EF-hand superfamily protein